MHPFAFFRDDGWGVWVGVSRGCVCVLLSLVLYGVAFLDLVPLHVEEVCCRIAAV